MPALTHATMNSSTPWYREPWPWLLMLGPVGVIVAGAFTMWLAVVNEDGLVADDYYKQGLAINKVIGRQSEAAHLALRARVLFGNTRVRVRLEGDVPPALTLQLVHPTRAGLDRQAQLSADAGGWYEGRIAVPADGRWHIFIEDGSRKWRLSGEWLVRSGESVLLDAAGTDGESR